MSTSRSLNRAMIIGNLTRDPVIKTTNSGSVVCTFGIATNTTWKDAGGNLQERTEFHNIVAWNKLGEICAQILSTGMLVFVEGELRTRVWDDETGNRHYKTEIKIDDMKLLDKKDKEGVGLEEARVENVGKIERTSSDASTSSENDEKSKEDEKEEESEEEDDDDDKKEEKKSEEKKSDDTEIAQEAEDLF